MKLYNEMKNAMAHVIEAEQNAAAWKQEAADRMRKVYTLIRAEQIASETKLNRKTVIDQLRAEFAPATEEPETEAPEADAEPETPESVNA